jgi:DNA-directed RNA polymerase subunit omega
MNPQLVVEASKTITDPHILVNLISRRVRQLNSGHRPMVEAPVRMGLADIALTEILEGKLTFTPEPVSQPSLR